MRLLEERRDEILGELRSLAPDLVRKLEETLDALSEQRSERTEYDGLDRAGVIRKYLQKVGRPAELREIIARFPAGARCWPDQSCRALSQLKLPNALTLTISLLSPWRRHRVDFRPLSRSYSVTS